MNTFYRSYKRYSAVYDAASHSFDLFYKNTPIIRNARIGEVTDGEKVFLPSEFKRVEERVFGIRYEDSSPLELGFFADDEAEKPCFSVRLTVSNKGVEVALLPEGVEGSLTAEIACEGEDCYPVSLGKRNKGLRAAIGGAFGTEEHAVYNRRTDCAVSVDCGNVRLSRGECGYKFLAKLGGEDSARVRYAEGVISSEYDVIFSPINKKSTFPTPPVGWMTWYAVKFDASEQKVLENAKRQAELFRDYGANTVWVDWEWYHKDMTGRREDGVNSLCPDPEKYPHGMKYVADKIKELGLIPSLWLGLTNEPSENEYIKKYPDMVLAENKTWCGRYYYDFSNPHYLNEFLPRALSNVHKWGYEAVKFDTIPISLSHHEKFRDNMYDKTLSPYDAYRQAIKRVKSELGENMYMLSCCGSTNSSVLWASDVFDAARVSADVFTWEEFCKTAGRVAEFYPLHNVQLYVDADNVVLRDEFSSYEQAKSRLALVSLLGLPMTFGDEFSALGEDKLSLIRKTLPILDTHSLDLARECAPESNSLITLFIDKGFEEYSVAGVFNFSDRSEHRTLSLCCELGLEAGEYLAYDFFRDCPVEVRDGVAELDLLPYECRVLAVRKRLGIPQILSTSRHITQGAAELNSVEYCGNEIRISASVIKDDPYTVTLYMPDGYRFVGQAGFDRVEDSANLCRLSLTPAFTGEIELSVRYEKI